MLVSLFTIQTAPCSILSFGFFFLYVSSVSMTSMYLSRTPRCLVWVSARIVPESYLLDCSSTLDLPRVFSTPFRSSLIALGHTST